MLTFRTFQDGAKEIFTAGQFAVFRHAESVNRLWELIEPSRFKPARLPAARWARSLITHGWM